MKQYLQFVNNSCTMFALHWCIKIVFFLVEDFENFPKLEILFLVPNPKCRIFHQ